MMVFTPLVVWSQNRPSSLKFFDAIPGFNDSSLKTNQSMSTADLDRLIKKYGGTDLEQIGNLNDMKLGGSPAENAWTIQRFIEYRSALRIHSNVGIDGLSHDLKWAAGLGIPYPNSGQLEKIESSLQNKDLKSRLDFAQNLPESQRKVYLDAAISSIDRSSVAVDVLARNLNLFSKERQSELALQMLIGYNVSRLSDQDLKNIKKLAATIDYSQKENICRGATALISLVGGEDESQPTPQLVEYYKTISRGFNLMQIQKVDCGDVIIGSTLQAKTMARAEAVGVVPRGYYEHLSSQPNLPAAVATSMAQCRNDNDYQSSVNNEILDYPKMLKGQPRYFVTNSKAKCSLRIVGKKARNGYQTHIVLFNTKGDQLFKIDYLFEKPEDIKNAALYGTLPKEAKAGLNAHNSPQTGKITQTKSAL
jgi:hypothetical protein